MSNNGNGKKKSTRWGSAAIAPELIDPTGQLHKESILPGFEGTPFRGPVPDLRHDDAMRKQPEMHYKVHVEVLDLSVEEDMKRFRDVCQTIANGFGQPSKEDMQYDAEKKNWRVFIRWMEFFSAMPKGMNNGNLG
jgi:hypothetical protein